MKQRLSFLFLLALAGLWVGAVSVAFPAPVLAMPAQNSADEALTRAYKAEQQWLNSQQQAIQKADQAAVQVQQVMDKALEAGLDVTALQNALGQFNSAISTVKTGHQSAAEQLSIHAGFDADGNVIDRQAARITVLDAKQALWKAHVSLSQAVRDLYRAVSEWKQATLPRN